ncbi:DUF2333 family protein [Pseudomonas sp. KHB2.9]
MSRAVLSVLGLYLLVTGALGWYWSEEPALFPVQQNAQLAAEKEGKQMVLGYTTVETLKTVAGTLLNKPGGYISNDRFPPGLWMDNMPSWEYGVLVQVRDLTRALRKDFARSQSQSAEDADLAKAEPRFNFDNKSWVLPSSESEYQEGINSLNRYEVRQAAAESNFHGNNRQLLNAAHFLYAVSAKRAQIENNDFRARQSYTTALQTLNDGEYPGEALRRLGLFGYVRESTVAELANGAIGTLADNWHSVAVIDGALDFYGKKQDLASSRWMSSGFRALKLV